MTSWRDRLCGSQVVKNPGENGASTIQQLLGSNEILSCGGGFFPVNMNNANMTTFKSSFILPTQKYSVLVFKKDGNAVIYSEEEEVASAGVAKPGEDKPKIG